MNQSNATRIAKSTRPYAVVFCYATSTRNQGDVLSTHKTHNLAQAAAKRSGYASFLAVRDARDYV